MEKDDAGIGRVRPEERRANRLRQSEADRSADQRAEQIGDLGGPQPRLDPDDHQTEPGADGQVRRRIGAERPRQHGRVRHRQNEQPPDE